MEAQLISLYRSGHSDWTSELSSWLTGTECNLHRRCTCRLGNAIDAEDAVQEISIKVIRAFGQFDGRASLRTWVISIAENHCYSMLRQRQGRTITQQLQTCLIDAEHERQSLADAHSARDAATEVHDTLQHMSENYRIILELRFFEDLSIAQMAAALNLSLSAAKMRLYRAMDAFRLKHALNFS